MRNAIERAVLATLLFRDLSLDSEFDKIVDYEIEYKLFKSNITCKAAAKAIYNQGLAPYDDEMILCYLSKHMDVNYEQWFDIIKTNQLSYGLMLKYIDELKSMDKDEKLKERLNDI